MSLLLLAVATSGCSGGPAAAVTASQPPPPVQTATPPTPTAPPASPSAAPTPTPAPLPPYAIDALRARPHTPGTVSVGRRLGGGAGYSTYVATWPSQGGMMTGVLHLPDGSGPFPVVIVNHGYVPASQYYVGQDSSKYADSLAPAGFLCVSPNYPGYSGSGPADPGVPPIVAEAMSDMDLISALPSLAQADTSKVAVAGHSNGGGVALILLAADARVRAAVLYAPVSSDMADNARKWWVHTAGGTGTVPSPDSDPQAYALMSPRGHLPANGPATLVMQGTNDEDIPAEWTAATIQALQAAGTRTRFVSFPGAMHNFRNADLIRANGLAVDWLRSVFG
jgi:dipeptidyl aminopeptidase/acylaminoacyl peptidase